MIFKLQIKETILRDFSIMMYPCIEAFYMKNLNGDEKLEHLGEKISKGKSLTSEDILTLTLIPLMSGKESSSDRSLKSITLAEKIPESNEKLQYVILLKVRQKEKQI